MTLFFLGAITSLTSAPFQATGIKIGEVTHESAIIWTRLTLNEFPTSREDGVMPTFVTAGGEELTPDGLTRPKNVKPAEIRWPEAKGIADIRYGAPGSPGETRVRYRLAGSDAWTSTDWAAVDPAADFTKQFTLSDLQPASRYDVKVESRSVGSAAAGSTVEGGFRTAPAPDQPAKVVFTVSTGQAFWDQDRDDGFQIYPTMLEKTDPDFFVHTGDIVYYDALAKSVDLANWHWQRTYSRPTNVAFHNRVSSYFIKDDHDTWTNDCWSTMKSNMFEFTWDDGIRIFPQQVPMGKSTHRTIRWGKDLQIWLVEGRDFRSPNTAPDGPDKTIWGKEQLAWFQQTFAASDATFRILISPTPIVGPDRDSKHDNHSNKDFTFEGDVIRAFLSKQKNAAVVCGDRHWQYHSIHPGTGVKEFSCGPASDSHAGGWKQSDYRDDYHKFLRVQGGYLSGTVDREDGKPSLTFRFHDVAGEVHFEVALSGD